MFKTIIISTEYGLKIMGGSELVSQISSFPELIKYENQQQPEGRFKDVLDQWEIFRQTKKLATRYNNPKGFFKMLAKAENNQEQPLAVVFLNEQGICAILMASIKIESSPCAIGPVRLPSPKLRSLSVGESAFIHDGGQATIETVKHVLDAFVKTKALDFIEMFNVLMDSPWYRLLNTRKNSGIWDSIEIPQVRWQTELVDSETGERLDSRSSKTRNTHRRKDKKLVGAFSDGVSFIEITKADQIDNFIKASSSIVEQTYQASLGIGVRKEDEGLKDFLIELAEDDYLRAYLLETEGKAICYVLGDAQSNVFSLWATSFLPEYRKYSPGVVLINRVMEKLADEGVYLFDFGYGDSAYKRELGSRMLNEADIRIYSKRLTPRVGYFLNRITMSADKRLRQVLGTGGRLDKARRFWRKILTKKGK